MTSAGSLGFALDSLRREGALESLDSSSGGALARARKARTQRTLGSDGKLSVRTRRTEQKTNGGAGAPQSPGPPENAALARARKARKQRVELRTLGNDGKSRSLSARTRRTEQPARPEELSPGNQNEKTDKLETKTPPTAAEEQV